MENLAQLAIVPVTLKTRGVFSALLEEARAWQNNAGFESWTYPFNDAWMIPRIERGELFLAFVNAEPIGAIRLLSEDHVFWGGQVARNSLYLHTFAVCRERAGTGLGASIIDQVAEMAREKGCESVRLDCCLSSTRLISFYERNGFSSIGRILWDGKMMNLMERSLL